MNVLNTSDGVAFHSAAQERLLASGLEELVRFSRDAKRMREALEAMKTLGDDNVTRRVDKMCRQIDSFEPSVTMIGQIKSGKTSLVNALVGRPDLLPADVNPWTSVVTSLHLHPVGDGIAESAVFRFFDADEWDRLVSGGGRIGELASRAGADDELAKIKAQVAHMREKTRARLGRRFEVLLGQEREYGYFDKDLIERYVCLGEEDDPEAARSIDAQGRFADITKSADLYMQRAALPVQLCLRDTPGVNDTFLMREQITIRAIRDSRLCVVTLSAHQALSSADLALIRLITHVKSRDVIIFVNRIDELADPVTEMDEIRSAIARTLKLHKGPEQAEVIFGSALWAAHALDAQLSRLPAASGRALRRLAGLGDPVDGAGATTGITDIEAWTLSGVPALQAAIAQRVGEGAGAALLQRIGASAGNLLDGLSAADRVARDAAARSAEPALDDATARRLMQDIVREATAELASAFDDILTAFSERVERVQANFLERATASLVVHLDRHGDQSPWTYDPAGLRVLLNSSHKVLARNSQAAFDAACRSASERIGKVYERAFSLGPDDLQVSPPRAPQVAAPVTLGRTIALDLGGSWWKRWWGQRRGYKTYSASYYELIKAETNPIVSELRDDLAQKVREEACTAFDAFMSEQFSVFETLAATRDRRDGASAGMRRSAGTTGRATVIETTRSILSEYASHGPVT